MLQKKDRPRHGSSSVEPAGAAVSIAGAARPCGERAQHVIRTRAAQKRSANLASVSCAPRPCNAVPPLARGRTGVRIAERARGNVVPWPDAAPVARVHIVQERRGNQRQRLRGAVRRRPLEQVVDARNPAHGRDPTLSRLLLGR